MIQYICTDLHTRICGRGEYRASLFGLIKQLCMHATTSIIQTHFSPIHSAQYTCDSGSTYLYITVCSRPLKVESPRKKKKKTIKNPRDAAKLDLRTGGRENDKIPLYPQYQNHVQVVINLNSGLGPLTLCYNG